MAPRQATELPSKSPLRLSTRLKTPSVRKRPQPVSQALKKSKKQCISIRKQPASAISEPSVPLLASAALNNVVDLSTDEDNDEEELGHDNEDIDEGEQPLSFTSTWRAVAGKESLPGVKTNIYNAGDVAMRHLNSWEMDVLAQLLPRRFDAIKFEAVASYEKCRVADECPQQIQGDSDLDLVMKVLQMWHTRWPSKALVVKITLYLAEKREEEQVSIVNNQQSSQIGGRKTTTQQQRASLPFILSTEQVTGNEIPSIADKWSCTNRSCQNYGYTCWQDRLPDAPDLPLNHYPVSGELMRLWGKEILNQRATADEPSTHLVCKLNAWRYREKKQPNKNPVPSVQSGSSTTDQLIQALLLREITHQPGHQQLQHLSQPSMLNSSPLRTSKDPTIVLAEFFNFLRSRPSWKSERQVELLETVESRILEDGWDIDQLKRIKKADWISYGFGIGTLERIKDEISFFKRQRPCSSSSSNNI